jgi:hypothetical protein
MKLGSITPFTKSGVPRFRTQLEFEEKFCTGCQEYWPCDPEFYRRMHGYWAARCRACEAEGVRQSRAKQIAKAVVLSSLLLGPAIACASTYCDSIAKLATAMQMDKEQGISRSGMAVALTSVTDDDARATSAAVLHLVYDGNADNGLTHTAMGRLARAACLTTEPNAMNARTP